MGICFGMQLAILESIRDIRVLNHLHLQNLVLQKKPVISMMNEWQKNNKTFKQDLKNLGGSMRG